MGFEMLGKVGGVGWGWGYRERGWGYLFFWEGGKFGFMRKV